MQRPLVLLFTVVALLPSCSNPNAKGEKTIYHLLQELPYADQASVVPIRNLRKEPVFRPSNELIHGKRWPSIAQTQSGSLSFYLKIGTNPDLVYYSYFQGRNASGLTAKIRIECDFPKKIAREYQVRLGTRGKIDLSVFEDRILKLSFAAENTQKSGLGSTIYWIDPLVEQVEKEKDRSFDTRQLAQFREQQRENNVLIFLFDAARAYHFSSYGYPKPTTPAADSLASEGVLFENAITQAVYTVASTGSLVSGLYPDAHGVLRETDKLQNQFKALAEFFKEAGYKTALFTAAPNASPLRGEDQGFEKIWEGYKLPGWYVTADKFVPEVVSWINQVQDHPFLGYIHFREPHAPYTPPQEFLTRFHTHRYPEGLLPPGFPGEEEKIKVIGAYDANLAFADQQLGRVLAHLRSTNLLDRTIIVVLSDHGEAFWEHGFQGHGNNVYDETARIPLIIRFPSEPGLRGKRITQVVGNIDLLPTLLDTLEMPHRGLHFHGKSLLPIILGAEGEPDRFLTTQAGGRRVYALYSQQFKYISYYPKKNQSAELYLLTRDPGESHNVIQDYPILSSYLRILLEKNLTRVRAEGTRLRGPSEEKAILDEEAREQLRALGYVY